MCAYTLYSRLNIRFRRGRLEDKESYVNAARDSKGGRDHHPARFTSYIKDPDREVYVCEVDSRPVSILLQAYGEFIYLPTCLPACLPACPLACLAVCLSACLPTCLQGCLPACLSYCLLACLPAFHSVWMFSEKYKQVLFFLVLESSEYYSCLPNFYHYTS